MAPLYSCLVTIVRAPGSVRETHGTALMLTDLTTTLFEAFVSIHAGDEIHGDLFDEPRLVASVTPYARPHASMQYWRVNIVPRSQVSQRPPTGPPITSTRPVAAVTVGAAGRAVENFFTPSPELAPLMRALDDVERTVEQLDSTVSRHDAAIDIEQIRMELKRFRADKSRVLGSVSRLNAVAGLEEESATLLPLVERLFLTSDRSSD